jgi:hypothetical protein
VGKNCCIKKIVINKDGFSNFDFKISINGVDTISIPVDNTTVFPFITNVNCSVLEGQYIAVHNVFPDIGLTFFYKMFVSLYIDC